MAKNVSKKNLKGQKKKKESGTFLREIPIISLNT